MTANGILQLAFYLIVLIALAKPLGAYMARVYEGRPLLLGRALGWLERLVYKVSGIAPEVEMGWKTYALTMLLFNLAGLLVVYGLQRLQGVLVGAHPGVDVGAVFLVQAVRAAREVEHFAIRKDEGERLNPVAGGSVLERGCAGGVGGGDAPRERAREGRPGVC